MIEFVVLAWLRRTVVPATCGVLLPVVLVLPVDVLAQEASYVDGRVISQSAGLPLPGATVILVGTLYGTVSDSAGTFMLGPVPAGSYQLRVTASGFGAVNMEVAVPSGPLIVRVTGARGRLPDSPVAALSGLFGAESYDASAAVSADTRAGLARVAGVELTTFNPAFSFPNVRALASGRTGAYSGDAPSVVLEVPGAGRFDVAALARARDRGIVVAGSHGYPPGSLEPAVVWHDQFDGVGEPATLQVDTGFLTNIRSAMAAGVYTGHSPGFDYRLSGRLARGGDYAAADGTDLSSAYRLYGGNIASILRLSASSRIFLAGSLARVASADLPGAVVEISSARHAGLSARWEWVPEGPRLRRLTALAGAAGSDADLRAADTAARALPRTDVKARVYSASVLADLAVLGREYVQVGLSLQRAHYDGIWYDALAPDGASIWPDALTHEGQFRVSTRFAGFRAASVVRMTLGYRSIRGGRGSAEDVARRFLTGSVSLSYDYQPRIAWTLRAIAELLRRPPSVRELLSDPTPDPDRVIIGRTSGNIRLSPESWLRLSASARREANGTSVEIRSFLAMVSDFIGHTLVDASTVDADSRRWVYGNRSARFAGFELLVRRQLAPFVSAGGHLHYVVAVDTDRSESLPLTPPLGGRLDLTAATPGERLLFELSSEFALSRSDVAVTLGETASKGFAVFQLRLGVPLSEHLSFRFGVYNLLNAAYKPLLNPTSVDAGRVPMPGRVWSFALRFQA